MGPLIFSFLIAAVIFFIWLSLNSLARTITSAKFAKNFTASMFETFAWVEICTSMFLFLANCMAAISDAMIAVILFSFAASRMLFNNCRSLSYITVFTVRYVFILCFFAISLIFLRSFNWKLFAALERMFNCLMPK